MNNIQSTEETNQGVPITPLTPNFEFKKKKFYDSPIEPVSAKPISTNQKDFSSSKG